MTIPIISILRKSQADCKHQHLKEPSQIRAEDFWMNENFYNKRIFIVDKKLKQCGICWKVLFPPEYDALINDLEKSCLLLAENISELEEIQLSFGNSIAEQEPILLRTDKGQELYEEILTPRYKLSAVVLSETTSRYIKEALIKIKYHEKIYEEWGFKEVDKIGIGVAGVFYGPSGTGKTICAEAVAHELKKKFLRVSAADISGRYMGDSSKNIRQVFQEAERNNALILFDEAYDFLGERFAKVTQGAEAEINSARSTLLIELEKFTGVVIFATNYYERIEKAFSRRLLYHVHFDLPDYAARKQLWNLHLPVKVPIDSPREELIEKLSEISNGLSGGDIFSIMRRSLPAALSQDSEKPIVSYSIFSQIIEDTKKQKSIIEDDEKSALVNSTRRLFGIKNSDS